MRPFVAIALGLALFGATSARAACPCYTFSSASNTHRCAIEAVAGTNPTLAAWQPIFDVVSQGPTVWGSMGPAVADIGQGCGKPEPSHAVPARFPCELLKAIAMNESGWRQFCRPTTPADQAADPERTIISFDCGYGIGQVTSGMHIGETPPFDRKRVAAEPLYNLATGASILAAKWRNTACVGDNQPRIVEDWYTATWAYNGLSYSNNPNNPKLDANRPVWNPKVGGAYAYQERVFGWVEHPPSTAHWTSVALAYPDRAGLGSTGAPPAIPEPSCASPTSCVAKRAVHLSACNPTPPTDGGTPGGDAASNDGDAPDASSAPPLAHGCGCDLGARSSAATPAVELLFGLLALLLQRSNRRHPRTSPTGTERLHRR